MSNKPKIKKEPLKEEYITLARLRRIVDTMKDANPSTPITFEYVCSWFAHSYDNFKKYCEQISVQSFKDGYAQAKKEMEESKDV